MKYYALICNALFFAHSNTNAMNYHSTLANPQQQRIPHLQPTLLHPSSSFAINGEKPTKKNHQLTPINQNLLSIALKISLREALSTLFLVK